MINISELAAFDIEATRNLHPVCTAMGQAVRIISFDKKDKNGLEIVALVRTDEETEAVCTYNQKG